MYQDGGAASGSIEKGSETRTRERAEASRSVRLRRFPGLGNGLRWARLGRHMVVVALHLFVVCDDVLRRALQSPSVSIVHAIAIIHFDCH